MPLTKLLIFTFIVLIGLNNYAYSQSNPDDFWLNHGFTSGQTIITNTGNFYDDGGFDLYHPSMNWTVTFCSENGNPITFDFDGFRTDYRGVYPNPPTGAHSPYDYMSISLTGANYVAFNDDTPQFSFTDPDGCITFGFRSQASSLLDSGWVAEISANPPPLNNDPCTAAPLSVGNICSPSFFSNKGAYNTTNLGDPSCHRYFGGDVWFRAVVPASGQLKIETFAGSLSYAIMALYRGTCTGLTAISCVDIPASMPATILTRPPGEVVFIRIFGDQAKSGTFGICATDPTAPVTGYTGPGGVGDSISNILWLRADSGLLNDSETIASDGQAVKTWSDMSGNLYDLIQANPISQAILNSTGINSNPAVVFDGSNDYYFKATSSASAPLSIFTVNSFNASVDQTLLTIGDATDNTTASISRETDDRYYSFSGSKNYGPVLPGGVPSILYARNLVNSPFHNLNINTVQQTVTNYSASLTTNGSLYLGSAKDISNFFNGNLGEVIMYSQKLNEAQDIIVHNYLAAKFGIDITTSDRYAFEAGHPHDVAGIGRTNALNIHSKARSAGVLSIGGATDPENNEFLLFGHDANDISSWTNSEVPSSDPNLMRLAREWRVDHSGGDGLGLVSLSLNTKSLPDLPVGFLSLNIMIDADGDFTDGAVDYGLIKVGDELIVNDVNIPDGAYIAIMAVKPYVSFNISESQDEESVDHPSIELNLNYAISDPYSVNYGVTGGTATAGGVDFSLNPGVLLFDPGTKNKVLQPLIIDDTIVELPDEYFNIEISNPTAGVLLGDITSFKYTIVDNDVDVILTASDTFVSECFSTKLMGVPTGRAPFEFLWLPAVGLSDPTNDTTNVTISANSTYTLRVTDVNGNSIERSIDIYFVPAPSKPGISISGATSFCQGDSVKLTADSATTYLWSSGEITREIVVKNNVKISVRILDEFGCESPPADSIQITVFPLPAKPIIDVGNLSFCDGESVELIAPESDSYLWSSGETVQSITVSTSGNYLVQVWDEHFCSSPVSDPAVVTVFALPEKPVISTNGVSEFCLGDSVELSAPESESYLWSTGETTNSITVKTSGSYTVITGNENSCLSLESDPVSIIVNPLPEKPVIVFSGDTDFCEGSSLELSAAPASSWIWSTGETTQSITVNVSASITLQVEDINSCISPASDPVVVTVFPLPAKPIIDIGNLSFCDGESIELIAPESDSYLWSTGETVQSITVSTSGNFMVQVWDEHFCSSPVSDPAVVTVFTLPEKPVISINGAPEFCPGDSVELSAPESESYLWSTGETTNSITVKTSGNYTVITVNENSCLSPESDPVTIIVNPLPEKPVIVFSGDTDFCEGSSLELSAAPASSWIWSTGETTQSITVNVSASITLQVEDVNSCISPVSDPVEIIVNENPPKALITPSGQLNILIGDSILLSSDNASGYLWSDGSTTREIYAKVAGFYIVVVTNEFGCVAEASDPVEIIVTEILPAPEIVIIGDTEFCQGGSVELISEPANSYLWSNGATTRSIIVNESGNYSLIINNGGVSSLESDIVQIIVNPIPELQLNTTGVSCFGGSDGTVTALITNGQSPYTFNWSNGGNTQTMGNLSADTYTLNLTDANLCQVSVSTEIISPAQLVISENIVLPACPDAYDGEISLNISGGTSPYSFDWDDAGGIDEITSLSPGIYIVTVTDNNNCSNEKSIVLGYLSELCFRIPDIITPNNDGKNDSWRIDGLELYPDVEVEIYDRRGKRLFYSRGYDTDWDGTFNGNELPMESYHYIIKLNNGSAPIIGNVTIVR